MSIACSRRLLAESGKGEGRAEGCLVMETSSEGCCLDVTLIDHLMHAWFMAWVGLVHGRGVGFGSGGQHCDISGVWVRCIA